MHADEVDVTYEWYSANRRGPLTEAEFASALPDARAEILYAVWPGADVSGYADDVRQCACALADLIGDPERRRTSYTAGDVREDFGAGFDLTAEACIRRWLGRHGCLKRGRWL